VNLISKTYWGGAPFQFRTPPDGVGLESRVIRTEDFREIRALYWTPRGTPKPKLAVIAMHPRVDFTHHYIFPALLEAGIACLGANTRHPNNDTDLVHEDALLDLGAAMRWLREHRAVERVILLGNSGGGSLAGFYQAQAARVPSERVLVTPAGEVSKLDRATLIAADAIALVAAHRGQGKVLLGSIDASAIDERDPERTDGALDMYSPENGFSEPPAWTEYDDAFLERYRAAQSDRVQRIDRIARDRLAVAKHAADLAGAPDFASLPFAERQAIERRAAFEAVMVVYRTMANPRYVDRRIEPSPREYGSLLSDRPDLMNHKALGFARTVTPRAWLSTWSGLSSNADLVRNLAEVTVPTLVVHAECDREVYRESDARAIFEAARADDKTFVEIAGAKHYFEPELGERSSPHRDALFERLVTWIRDRF
jgi:alpha-beta hydrolase superfamily lysophospholipase